MPTKVAGDLLKDLCWQILRRFSLPFGGHSLLVILTAVSVIPVDILEAVKTISSGKYFLSIFKIKLAVILAR